MNPMIKSIFKTILKYYLKIITKITLYVHHPRIIAIAGSTNKSFFKSAAKSAIEDGKHSVRANPKNFNTEIGLPLAILDLESGYNTYTGWMPVVFNALGRIFKSFPDYLVLELGVSDPGDMRFLLSLVEPDIVVITDITQRYLESFSDMDELTTEYEVLVKRLKKDGLCILNNDNSKVAMLSKFTDAKIETFGICQPSDIQAYKITKDEEGTGFDVIYNKNQKFSGSYRIKYFGDHHISAFLAALIIKNHVDQKSQG
jgi:UDP-N-acetylmuramoyl-tripeptide--D-alanyl-D-alanine ligase